MKLAPKLVEEARTPSVPSAALAMAMGRALASPWQLLVLVPSSAKGLATFAPELERLSGARAFEGLWVVDARGLPGDARPELLSKLEQKARAVILVDPPNDSVLATLLCADADALLLVAHMNETRIDSARELVDRCGREKFVGSLLLTEGE